jgi:hypothetical protein
MMDCGTGEVIERRLQHEKGEARAFYAGLPAPARGGWRPPGMHSGSSRCWPSKGTNSGLATPLRFGQGVRWPRWPSQESWQYDCTGSYER